MQVMMAGWELAKRLDEVMVFIPKRPPRPVFQNVRLEVSDGELHIVGSDMESTWRGRVVEDVKVTQKGGPAGAALVPAARLQKIVKELKGEDVTLEWSSTELMMTIKAKGCRFQLVCEDAADYPAVVPFPASKSQALPAASLVTLLKRTGFAAASKETRYAIHGTLLEWEKPVLRAVTTDGKRLAVEELQYKGGKKKVSVLFPGGRLMSMLKACDADEKVDVVFEDRKLLVRTNKGDGRISLIEGTFPAWREVLPSKCPYSFNVNREALAAAVRRAALMTSEGSLSVTLAISEEGLHVRSRSSNVGESSFDLAIEWSKDSTSMEITYNPKYLLESLKVMDTVRVTIQFSDSRLAMLLEETRADGQGLRTVIMPVTLESASSAVEAAASK